MKYGNLLEKLILHYTGPAYSDEVNAAKKIFSEMAGIIDEDSQDSYMKMSQFIDWYIFVRPQEKLGGTPAKAAIEDKDFSIAAEEKEDFQCLAASKRSLFEFMKLKGDDVYIKDLLSGYKLVIKGSKVTIGFNKEELFEARLIPDGDEFLFGSSFCLHPPQASKFILKEIKKVKKLPEEEQSEAREKLIDRLFRMRYKHEQYKHVELKDIYSNDSKLNL